VGDVAQLVESMASAQTVTPIVSEDDMWRALDPYQGENIKIRVLVNRLPILKDLAKQKTSPNVELIKSQKKNYACKCM
jgi:hypothetical protein